MIPDENQMKWRGEFKGKRLASTGLPASIYLKLRKLHRATGQEAADLDLLFTEELLRMAPSFIFEQEAWHPGPEPGPEDPSFHTYKPADLSLFDVEDLTKLILAIINKDPAPL